MVVSPSTEELHDDCFFTSVPPAITSKQQRSDLFWSKPLV